MRCSTTNLFRSSIRRWCSCSGDKKHLLGLGKGDGGEVMLQSISEKWIIGGEGGVLSMERWIRGEMADRRGWVGEEERRFRG